MRAFYGAKAVLLCVMGSVSAGVGQQPATAAPATGSSRQVLLDVVVSDKSGRPVAGLPQQDFTVLDGERVAKILAFKAHNAALTPPGQVDASTEIVLVLDEVNAPWDRATYAKQGIQNFLRQNNGNLEHPVSLALFSEDGLQLQTQPSIDGNALASALEKQVLPFRMLDKGTGFHGDQDRLQLSQDALDSLIVLERKKPGRKMVIWLSPGWPLINSAQINLSAAQEQRSFRTIVDLSTALQQARITLYSVDPMGAEGDSERRVFYQNFVKPVIKASDAQPADIGLQVLATQTGGRAIFGNDTIMNSINHCVADLNAFYSLEIETFPSLTADEFHNVAVKVPVPELRVRTRDGYYAQP